MKLGKKLWFEPRLSRSGFISCNSCHNLSMGGTDNIRTSIGDRWQEGPINSPTVLNSSLNVAQFWDGRAASEKRMQELSDHCGVGVSAGSFACEAALNLTGARPAQRQGHTAAGVSRGAHEVSRGQPPRLRQHRETPFVDVLHLVDLGAAFPLPLQKRANLGYLSNLLPSAFSALACH